MSHKSRRESRGKALQGAGTATGRSQFHALALVDDVPAPAPSRLAASGPVQLRQPPDEVLRPSEQPASKGPAGPCRWHHDVPLQRPKTQMPPVLRASQQASGSWVSGSGVSGSRVAGRRVSGSSDSGSSDSGSQGAAEHFAAGAALQTRGHGATRPARPLQQDPGRPADQHLSPLTRPALGRCSLPTTSHQHQQPTWKPATRPSPGWLDVVCAAHVARGSGSPAPGEVPAFIAGDGRLRWHRATSQFDEASEYASAKRSQSASLGLG